MLKRGLIRLAAFVLTVVSTVAFVTLVDGGGPSEAKAKARGPDFFTNLTFTTSEGKEVRFYDDLIKDKIVVIHFMYTECRDMCSLTTARLAQLYQWLGERVGDEVHIISITLDPEQDTPEKLAAFAEGFGAGKGWTFVTAPRETVDSIRYRLGEKARNLAEHRSDMVIGNDRTDVWRRSSVMGSLTIALQSVLELDPDFRTEQRLTPEALKASLEMTPQYDLAAHPGEALFLRTCASCHTIGSGPNLAPDLEAVTLRRDPSWLLRFVREPDLMLDEGDPIAVALNSEYPQVKMPYLGLSKQDAIDVVGYLLSQDAELIAMEQQQSDAWAEFQKATGGVQGKIDVYLPEN